MSSSGEPTAPAKGQLDREAAEWCVRLHGDEAEAWRPQFEAWLKRGALHRNAYNRIEEVYLLGAKLPRRVATPAAATRAPLRSKSAFVASLGAVACLVAALWIVKPGSLPELVPSLEHADTRISQQLQVKTAPGRAQQLSLRDGSIVTLAGGSSLVVDFAVDARRLTLLSGAARFDVAHAAQPFVVWAGGGSITARGTRFEVRVNAQRRVYVRLIEGQIEVRSPQLPGSGSTSPPALLEAGEARSYAAALPRPAITVASGAAHQPETVGELVDLSNAQGDATVQVIIADPSLRAVRLGGRFQVREPAVVAEQLAAIFDLELDRSDPRRLVLTRRR